MSETNGGSRAAKVDAFVLRNTLGTVLHNVGQVCDVDESEDVGDAISADLFNELWPGVPDGQEYWLAHARSMAQTAAMLSQLATDGARGYLLNESARLSALAASHVRRATAATNAG